MANSSAFIDTNGNSVAFWLKHIGANDVVQVSTTAVFGGTWSAPINISNPAVTSKLPSMGANINGDIVLGWAEPVGVAIANIFVSIRPISTGIWSPPFQLVNAGSIKSPVKISVNEAGQIITQWTAYTDLTLAASAIYVASATVATGIWSAVSRVSF